MNTAVASVQSALAAIVGEPRVTSDAAARAAVAIGGTRPQYVVAPPTAESLAAVLKLAAEHDLAVIPRGNGTKIAMGGAPRRYDLALSLEELKNVWHYEAADLTITVGAGMNLGDLQHFLGRERLWLPLDPAGGACASIGGTLAANSSGPLRLRFGSARDVVLGMKVATTDGTLIKSGGRVVKNVAGYDLSKLLIGSYGTLGVIVEASFKLFPRPASRATWVLEPETLGAARELRMQILNSPLEPMRMVLFNTAALDIFPGAAGAGQAEGLQLWVEAGGSAKILERHASDLAAMGRSLGGVCRQLDAPMAEACWERMRDYEQLFAGTFQQILLLKATLPIAASEEFLSFAQQTAEGEGVQMAVFAQPGVGTLHLGLRGATLDIAVERLVANTRKAALELKGALVVEHYPDAYSGERDIWGPLPDSLEVMRRLKLAWDPKGVLSPGRFMGGI